MIIRPPAHVEPYVRVLGQDDAVRFLLMFGGGELYLSERPAGRSRLAEVFGADRAAAVASAIGHLKVRVPTAKPWVAHVLRGRGLPVDEIARTLHASNVAVRRWLRAAPDQASGTGRTDDRQLPLL